MNEVIQVTAIGHPRWISAAKFSSVEDLPDGGANVIVDICGVPYPGVLTREMASKLRYIRMTKRLGREIDSVDWAEIWKQANEPEETEEESDFMKELKKL